MGVCNRKSVRLTSSTCGRSSCRSSVGVVRRDSLDLRRLSIRRRARARTSSFVGIWRRDVHVDGAEVSSEVGDAFARVNAERRSLMAVELLATLSRRQYSDVGRREIARTLGG